MKTSSAAYAVLLMLAGCHSQPTAGGLSAEDERELDNAASLVDQQNIFGTSPDGLGTDGLGTDGLGANGAEVDAPAEAAPSAPANGQ